MLESNNDIYDILSDIDVDISGTTEVQCNKEQLGLLKEQIILICEISGMKDVSKVRSLLDDIDDLHDEDKALYSIGLVNKLHLYDEEFLTFLNNKNLY